MHYAPPDRMPRAAAGLATEAASLGWAHRAQRVTHGIADCAAWVRVRLAPVDSRGACACGHNELATQTYRVRLRGDRYSTIPHAAFKARPHLEI